MYHLLSPNSMTVHVGGAKAWPGEATGFGMGLGCAGLALASGLALSLLLGRGLLRGLLEDSVLATGVGSGLRLPPVSSPPQQPCIPSQRQLPFIGKESRATACNAGIPLPLAHHWCPANGIARASQAEGI